MKQFIILIASICFYGNSLYCSNSSADSLTIHECFIKDTQLATECKSVIDSVLNMADNTSKNVFYMSFIEKHNTPFCYIQDWDLKLILEDVPHEHIVGFVKLQHNEKSYTLIILNYGDNTKPLISEMFQLGEIKTLYDEPEKQEQSPNIYLALDEKIIVYLSQITENSFVPMYIIDNGKIVYDNRVTKAKRKPDKKTKRTKESSRQLLFN